MAKKGAALQLQIEVENDEEWEKLVEREGLIVVDVYSDWCGPCTGMVGNLRKLKLELGGDVLTLAIAKADGIECLERFRNKSEPTWMFISHGKLIKLIFGTNAPRLMRVITEEIAAEKKALEEETPREGIDFNQLTDEEQERVDEETRIREEAARVEEEARQRAICERREAVVESIKDNIKEYDLIILWPHVNYEQLNIVHDVFNQSILSSVGKPAKKTLTEEEIFEMMYFNEDLIDHQILDQLASGECCAICYQAPSEFDMEQLIPTMYHIIYGEEGMPPGGEESLARKLEIEVEKELEEVEEEELQEESLTATPSGVIAVSKSSVSKMRSEITSPSARIHSTGKSVHKVQQSTLAVQSSSFHPTKSRIASSRMISKVHIEEPAAPPPPEMITIPGIWTPPNDKTKSMATKILFPHLTAKFELPEPEVIPPHLIVAFDAFKKREVLEVAAEYPQETMKLGFFTSADPETAELLAKTPESWQTIPAPP